MKLEHNPMMPALWVNPAWVEGTPGTFAMIIGVSRYDHLEGNEDPTQRAANTYNLPQLAVSALSAHAFLRWMSDQYDYGNCPVAKCWLLLSPSREEEEVFSLDPEFALAPIPPANLPNCKKALDEWRTALALLPLESAKQSRAFFFFCGHGFEIWEDQQLLLPCDYLKPPYGNENDCLPTKNIRDGLRQAQVPMQFYFIDACRNDHPDLREGTVVGNTIWQQRPTGREKANILQRVIYASASGSQTMQPANTAIGKLSVYSEALLEGLHHPRAVADQSEDPWKVCYYELGSAMDQLMNELIHTKYKQMHLQAEIAYGGKLGPKNPAVTHLGGVHVVPPEAAQPQAPSPGSVGPSPMDPLVWEQGRSYNISRELQDWHPSKMSGQEQDQKVSIMSRDLFGSEAMSHYWVNARIFSLSKLKWLEEDSNHPSYLIHHIEYTADFRAYRMVLSIPGSSGGYWLQLSNGSRVAACLLAESDAGGTRYTLEFKMDFPPEGEGGFISRLEANLALENPGLIGRAAAMWESYRHLQILEATQMIDSSFLEAAITSRQKSPLAATVAGIILLRVQSPEARVEELLRKLATEFLDFPDGPVLWAQYLVEQNSETKLPSEAITWLLELPERGLPQTREAMGYAISLVDEYLYFGEPTIRQRVRLEELQSQLRDAFRYFRRGGLFSTFSGPEGVLEPGLMVAESSGKCPTI